ncbi:MutT/NUDIX hydrolase, partial [Haematococcus lacustris]
ICGSPMRLVQPPTEHEWRHVCSSVACGYTDYFNPRMVVGCIVEHQGKILLCRETLEEAGAVVTITAPYCHWDIPIIGQAYVLFRAQLAPPFSFSAGPESQEVALFSPADIPHAALAFSSIAITLRLYQEDLAAGHFRLHHGVIDKRPGSGPNDPASFVVRDHMALDLQAAEGSAMQPH